MNTTEGNHGNKRNLKIDNNKSQSSIVYQAQLAKSGSHNKTFFCQTNPISRIIRPISLVASKNKPNSKPNKANLPKMIAGSWKLVAEICTNEANLNRILTKLGGSRKLKKTENVPNEPNLKTSHPADILTFALFTLPFEMCCRLVSNGPLLASFWLTLVSFGSHLASFGRAFVSVFTHKNQQKPTKTAFSHQKHTIHFFLQTSNYELRTFFCSASSFCFR